LDKLAKQRDWTRDDLNNQVLDLLHKKISSVRSVETRPYMLVYRVDRSKFLDQKIKKYLIFVVGHLPDTDKALQYDYLNAIQTLVIQESLSLSPHFLVFINTSERIQNDYHACLYNFKIIDVDTFKSILQGGGSKIIDILQKYRPFNVVSPFKYLGPCSPDLFVGREDIISNILNNRQAGYAITGGRRIGKTSLLLKIQYDISERNKQKIVESHHGKSSRQGFDCCYVDCINLYSFQDVYDEIFRKMNPRLYKKQQTNDLTELVNRTSALKEKKLLLMLDEMDDLMEMASVNDTEAIEFQKNLQKAANQGMLKFIICGFRNISQVIHNPKHPFFNLCKGIYLNTLKKREIKKLLIMSDLKQLFEIKHYNMNKVVDRLYEASGGYPSVIQFIADQLIRTDNEGIVFPNTIGKIMDSKETRAFVLETLIMNTNTFERLICILAVNLSIISNETVINALLGKGVQMKDPDQDVLSALNNLSNNCILNDCGNEYTFLYPLIPEIINKYLNNTTPRLLKTLAYNHG